MEAMTTMMMAKDTTIMIVATMMLARAPRNQKSTARKTNTINIASMKSTARKTSKARNTTIVPLTEAIMRVILAKMVVVIIAATIAMIAEVRILLQGLMKIKARVSFQGLMTSGLMAAMATKAKVQSHQLTLTLTQNL